MKAEIKATTRQDELNRFMLLAGRCRNGVLLPDPHEPNLSNARRGRNQPRHGNAALAARMNNSALCPCRLAGFFRR